MLRRDTGHNDAMVVACILYSDATAVTQNGRDSVWPVYLTLANLPLNQRNQPGSFQLLAFMPDLSSNVMSLTFILISNNIFSCDTDFPKARRPSIFSECLENALKPLKDLSNTGFMHEGRMMYPLFYCYVHDYPEGSKVETLN